MHWHLGTAHGTGEHLKMDMRSSLVVTIPAERTGVRLVCPQPKGGPYQLPAATNERFGSINLMARIAHRTLVLVPPTYRPPAAVVVVQLASA